MPDEERAAGQLAGLPAVAIHLLSEDTDAEFEIHGGTPLGNLAMMYDLTLVELDPKQTLAQLFAERFEGTAEIGYSVLPQFQGRGYATEIVVGLVRWALGQPGVARVVAETEWANPASVRVLTKAGFAPAGLATEPGGARFDLVSGA